MPDRVRKVLIIQLGDIGDVVWALPTFRAVGAALPRAEIFLLVREGIGALFEADPVVAGVFEVERFAGDIAGRLRRQAAFLLRVRKARFDLVFDLRCDERGAFMARWTGAPFRASLVATDSPWFRNRLFTHLVYPPDENVRVRLGASEQTLRIVRQFGIPTPEAIPTLTISPAAREKMKAALAARDIPALGFITMNPFSRWTYKEWPSDRWPEIASRLFREYGLPAVLVGSAGERARAGELAKAADGGMVNMTGETTLGELAALLSLSRLHIGVDSAAPHVAAAVGTPTITIYGPSDWRDWAPVGEGHQVVVSDMACSPCHRKGCDGRGWSRCLENIPAEKVWAAMEQALRPLKNDAFPSPRRTFHTL
ncbi:MAG: glycosyltransferase family 9 protein [Pseudomonadota bacterium]|nr:glycosyltransferase family 9 protein [Pseudomonadota bacterium]